MSQARNVIGNAVAISAASSCAVLLFAIWSGRGGLWLWGPMVVLTVCVAVSIADLLLGGELDEEEEDSTDA
jgi:hypothetical protein